MSEKKAVRLTDTWRMILRALRHTRELTPWALARTLSLGVVKGARPFVAIYVTAWVINALSRGAGARTVITGALVGAGIACAAQLLEAGLTSLNHLTNGRTYYRTEFQVNRKYLETDFERLEQPEFQKLKLDFQWMFGMPTTSALEFVGALVAQAVGVCFAIATAAPLLYAAGLGMSLLALGSVALSLVLTFLLQAARSKLEYRYMRGNELGNRMFNYVGMLARNYKNGLEVRVFRAQGLLRHIGRHMNDRMYVRWGQTMAAFEAATEAIAQLLGGAIYLIVALVALSGAFPVGSVVLFVGALTRLAANLGDLIRSVTSRELARKLETYFGILDAAPIKYQGTLSTEKRDDAEYDIEFRDVSFKYPGSDLYALRHLDLKLRVGQHLAVVGRNGSGKTTMIKLLCRLYDPTEGVITLNGIDIRKYDLRQYMDLFSVVFQDFKLFSFKAGENVAADLDFDRARVIDCCERAGYPGIDPDMVLYKDLDEKGVEISGGEAQKLALARALYRNAPFMVLDEPTAALDPVAEFEIYSRFNTLMRGHTAIYISHRLSSCRFCDDIAVFDEGALTERGSHDELLARGGRYAELWGAQAQYYTA